MPSRPDAEKICPLRSHIARSSPYNLGKRLFSQAMGGRVKLVYDSHLRSLRPCSRNGASREINREAIGGKGGCRMFAGVGRVRRWLF